METHELKEALVHGDLPSFLAELLPAGKIEGNYYIAGDTEGSEGRSLRVRLSGDNAGIWSDFAEGSKGDIFALVMQVKSCGFRDALSYVREYLGIRERPKPDIIQTVRRTYTTPALPSVSCTEEVLNYLGKSRGLGAEVIQAFGVSSTFYNFPDNMSVPSVVFPFVSPQGNIELVKYLGVLRPEGRRLMMASPNSRPVLFGWRALDPRARTVVITKGEIEAMSFHQLGIPALAVPFGEGKGKHGWLEHEYENLEHFENIILHADDDKPGHDSIAELSPKLGRHRCRFLFGSPIDGLKDVNDALVAGVTPGAVADWLATARSCDPAALKQATAFTDDVVTYFHDHSLRNKGYPFPIPSFEDSARIRLGELSIWTGFSGSGKSEFLGQTALYLSSLGAKALIASFEMSVPVVIGRLLRQHFKTDLPTVDQIKEGAEWMADRILFYDYVGNAKLEAVLEIFAYATKKFGVQFFVLDSLMKCGVKSDDYNAQQEFIDALQNFAHEYNVHVALVAHSRKKEDDDKPVSRLDVKGSGTITDLAELVVGIHRNRRKEKDLAVAAFSTDERMRMMAQQIQDNEPDATISILKQRNGDGSEPTARCLFDKNTKLFREM